MECLVGTVCSNVCVYQGLVSTPSRWSEHIEPTIFHKIFDCATPWASVSVHQIINITCLLEKVHWRSHVAVPNLKAHDLEISSRYGLNFKGATSFIFNMVWSFNHPLLGPYFGFISNSPKTGLHTVPPTWNPRVWVSGRWDSRNALRDQQRHSRPHESPRTSTDAEGRVAIETTERMGVTTKDAALSWKWGAKQQLESSTEVRGQFTNMQAHTLFRILLKEKTQKCRRPGPHPLALVPRDMRHMHQHLGTRQQSEAQSQQHGETWRRITIWLVVQ